MTTDDGTGRLRHARCEGEQNEGDAVYIEEHMSCLQRNEGEHVCVWAHACLHGTILAIKEGRGGFRGRRGRITHCGGRTKNVSVPDAIPCAGGAQTRDALPTH